MAGAGLLSLVATTTGAMATEAASASAAPRASGAVTVHLGYFPNLTHGVALVGISSGLLAKALGPDHLDASTTFTAGSVEANALLAGSIDIAFIGPSPAIKAYEQSSGAIQIVAGAASGGAALVVKRSITSVSQLGGTTLATPQAGNTQDVALRYFLTKHGYSTTGSGSKHVTVLPNQSGSNGDIVQEFRQGLVAGAWMPEPYVAEMVADGGHVLVNERSLWPGGRFASTEIVVRTAFLKAHPATVTRFLRGIVATLSFIKSHPAAAKADINTELAKLSGKALKPAVLNSAWSDLSFTDDPLASTLAAEVAHGVAVGQLSKASIAGIVNVGPLNGVLKAAGQSGVSAGGLG